MADNIKVDPGTGDSSPLVATRTLNVNSVPAVEVPYGIIGVEAAGALVPVDAAHPLPVSLPVGATVAVTAGALPLPAGAATEASLATANAYLATIAGGAGPISGTVAVSNFPATQAVTGTFWQATQPVSGAVSVSNFPATQPVSGTVAVSNLPATQPVSLASLPALAAGSNVIGHVVVDAAPTTPVTGTFWQATQPVSGTFWQATQPVSAASLPLPSGASTETTLASLNGKVTACNTGAVVVSSLPALPAGSATIGVVNAQQAGDVIEIAGTTYTVKRAFANATASGETTVVAAVASKKIRVLAYSIGPVSAAVNVYFDNATNGAVASTKYLAANGGMGRAFSPFGHFETGTVNEALRINLSATANAGIDLLYIEV